MNNKGISYIALRILSIYFSMTAITNITKYLSIKIKGTSYPAPLDPRIGMYSLILTITSIASYLIVGIILWIKTDKFTNYLIPKNSYSEKIEMESSKEFLLDIQVVAFSIVGIVVTMSSINFIYQNIVLVAMLDNKNAVESIIEVVMGRLGGRIITLILGLILFLKPRKIAKLIRTL